MDAATKAGLLDLLAEAPPLVEQGQDLGHIVGQQPVHRGSARRQLKLLRAELGLDPPPADTGNRKNDRRKSVAA